MKVFIFGLIGGFLLAAGIVWAAELSGIDFLYG